MRTGKEYCQYANNVQVTLQLCSEHDFRQQLEQVTSPVKVAPKHGITLVSMSDTSNKTFHRLTWYFTRYYWIIKQYTARSLSPWSHKFQTITHRTHLSRNKGMQI
jgi:hypothetical protein